MQFYKYEQIIVKFMCELFGRGYCVLLTVNMLCYVEVMFAQLLNLLEIVVCLFTFMKLSNNFNNCINTTST